MTERKEFFKDLAVLLKKHNVELNATEDCGPLIEFDFVDNYTDDIFEVSSLNAEKSASFGEILIDAPNRDRFGNLL